MIQRIQSLWLLLSAVLGVVCLSLPLGYFCTEQGERVATLYNLWLRNLPGTDSAGTSFAPWALFALLLAATTLTLIGIFLFKTRALQMRLTSFCMILLVGWYAFLGFFVWRSGLSYTPSVTAALPFACIVLDYLAFRGIMKDEMLIRSLDRLR